MTAASSDDFCRQDEPEYYPIGHDVPESLFDKRLAAKSRRDSSLSFLMCGIGDARNLWETLNSIVLPDKEFVNQNIPKELHFTLVDLKPAALARILILLRLMSQLPTSEELGGQVSQDLTWAMAYLYVGHIVPPFVHATLSKSISDLIGVLERNSPKNPFLKWIVMSEDTRAQVLQHLRLWSEPLEDLYRPMNMRTNVHAAVHDARMCRMMNGRMDADPTPATCEEDEAIFDKFTTTPPPEAFIRRHEPQIAPMLEQMRSKKRSTREQAGRNFDDYINNNWNANMTMIDLVWEAKKERNFEVNRPAGLEWTKLTAIDGDPVSMAKRLLGDITTPTFPGQKGVIELVASYFFVVSLSLHNVLNSSKVRVEMIAGEMTDTMERIRYGHTDGRAGMKTSVSLPQQFDRVHMSNIPCVLLHWHLKFSRPFQSFHSHGSARWRM